MVYLLISIIGIVVTIFFVIGTHEFAHFLAARLLGIKVLRFSIGFGKTLRKWHDKSGTEYVVAAFQLGGYVKMLDENEGKVPERELSRAFNRQPFYKKFLVVLAGPTMNLFCALVLYWLIFFIGFVNIKPVIGTILPNSIAAKSGLKANQEIISIDNQTTSNWTSVIFRLLAHTGDKDKIKISVSNFRDATLHSYVLDATDWQMGGLTPDPLSSLGIIPY